MVETYPNDHELAAAESSFKAAQQVRARAARQLRRSRLRLLFARCGVDAWVAMLVSCVVLSLVMALPAIFIFGAPPPALLVLILASFAVGWVPAWSLLEPEPGEAAEDRYERRARAAELSKRSLVAAQVSEAAAQARVVEIKRIRASAEGVRAARTARLLSIEVGRLYPDEFERHVSDIFSHLGYSILVTGKTGDQGVDVLAERNGWRIAIQAKRYDGGVGNAAVQQIYAGMAHYRCQRCAVVTTSHFSRSAIELARSVGCVLISKDEISALIQGQLGF